MIEGWDEEREIAFYQTLIVTYSLKYRLYQRNVRKGQIDRAMRYMEKPSTADRRSQLDAKRFIKKTTFTNDGEIADNALYEIDKDVIAREEMFDGFYAVCTNLDEDPATIAKINHDRWEIEESFRIMKVICFSEFFTCFLI